MTTLREAAQDSLRALLLIQPQVRGSIPRQDVEDAIDALKAALAGDALDRMADNARELGLNYDTAPPQRKPLAEEEIDKVSRRWVPVAAYMGLHEHAEMTQEQAQQSMRKFARAIERAHGVGGNDE